MGVKLLCMRTTLDIRDDVLVSYKRLAAETNRPLREVVEDALRAELQRRAEPEPDAQYQRVVTSAGNGLRPGVNLDSAAELQDVMDENYDT
jgi:hypothetical protein